MGEYAVNPNHKLATVFAVISLAFVSSGCDFLNESNSVTVKFPRTENCEGRSGVGSNAKANNVLNDGQFVALAYFTILQRPPEPEGLNGYCLLLKSGAANRKQLIDRFVASPEFSGIK